MAKVRRIAPPSGSRQGQLDGRTKGGDEEGFNDRSGGRRGGGGDGSLKRTTLSKRESGLWTGADTSSMIKPGYNYLPGDYI